MATNNTYSIAYKYGLPQLDDSEFEHWKHEIELWQLVTDLPKGKQGPVIYLSLSGKARLACACLTKEQLNADDGVEILTTKLSELYAKDKDQATYEAYEKFETFRRDSNMNIRDYINEFEHLNDRLKQFKIDLPDAVLAYQLLKNANLPADKRDLARATISSLTFVHMKKQINAIYDHCSSSELESNSRSIKVDPDPVYYSNSNRYNRGSNNRGGSSGYQRYKGKPNTDEPKSGYSSGKDKPVYAKGNQRSMNRIDSNTGKPSKCVVCESIFHWAADCPDSHENRRKDVNIQLFTKNTKSEYMEIFVSETLNSALLDSGCTSTVCGENWLKCYLDSLDVKSLQRIQSDNQFRFGDGKVFKSSGKVNLPATIGNVDVHINTDVIDCEIPLLLSKESMKAANTKLDFVSDSVNMYGKDITLNLTANGHYCIPISAKQSLLNKTENPNAKTEQLINLTITDLPKMSRDQKESVALKLHKQFGHPIDSNRLKKMLHEAKIFDGELEKYIDYVTNSCDTCNRYRKAQSRPVVSFSLGEDFNDVLALDLKFIGNHIILHMIDTFTRYSQAAVVKNKTKEVIADSILKHWISIFGCPKEFFSDQGGEFNNELLRDVAELLNISVHTTAAESPWSNGIVERHNAVLADILTKVMDDNKSTVDVALPWSLNAKNSLHSSSGFSPNQLVMGRNPNLPSILNNKLPAFRSVTSSKLIADHLNALHKAREAFTESESSEKLKRALRRKTRTASSRDFANGDSVYYKRNDNNEWRGPGRIIGVDGKVILVRHGGKVVSVAPCSIRKVNDNSEEMDNLNAKCANSEHIDITLPIMDAEISVGHTEETDSAVGTQVQNTREPIEIDNTVNENANSEIHTDTITRDNTCNLDENSLENIAAESIPINSGQTHTTNDIENACADCKLDSNAVNVPHLKQRIEILSPDFDKSDEVVVISRAGKIGKQKQGVYKYWFNVQSCSTQKIKALDFSKVKWKAVDKEVLYNSNNDPAILEAKCEELERWREYDVYDEVDNIGQKFITVRWVITEKYHDQKLVKKARLVARGFEEDDNSTRNDSPTCSKNILRLVCNFANSNKWPIQSMDITAAFLQGTSIDREVFLKPPVEAGTKKLWKLRASVYGLKDASRSWYKRICEELIKIGVNQSIFEPALFFWKDDGKLSGLICCHVDDLFYAGSAMFQKEVIDKLRGQFQLSKEHFESFTYVGIDITQENGCIYMDQRNYIESIEPIDINKGSTHEEKLSEIQMHALKRLGGQLLWVAKQTRPDMLFSALDVSSNLKNSTVHELYTANKYVKKLKLDHVKMVLPDLGPVKGWKIYVYSDASLGKAQERNSQGGYIIFIIGNNTSAPYSWASHKLKRVVKSSLGAETLALQEAAGDAIFLKQILQEICCEEIPIICRIDNQSLFDNLQTTNSVEDKRLQLDICYLRDMIERKEINAITWIPTDVQLADCLTKRSASSQELIHILGGHALVPQ